MKAGNSVLALLAGMAGGVLGYFAFLWIARQGFYALVLPGALVGVGASFLKPRSVGVCVVCGVMALAAGLFTEWRFAPFTKDPSMGYFVAHLLQLPVLTWIMIAAGAAIGFWSPFAGGRAGDRADAQG